MGGQSEGLPNPSAKEARQVKTRLVATAAAIAIGVALLAGKDDIRRFWRMRQM